MASSSPPLLPDSLKETLAYFARYDYPLLAEELWFWQHGTQFSKLKIEKLTSNLKFQISNWATRKQRELWSQGKWLISKKVGEQLSKIKFIEAIFVTGALAMDNCTPDDDIDFMIITCPHTLWLTRILVYFRIRSFRRKPKTTAAPNLICDNLYLDTNHLAMNDQLSNYERDLYLAHEVLQTKCVFDRSNVHYRLLTANPWVKSYLPVAYAESLKKFENLKTKKLFVNCKLKIENLLWPFNLLAFLAQYLYMKSKMTSERVSLGYAFFHPRKN